jgi:hypothetical protein
MTSRTPDWLVERLHHGDLPPDEAAAVRARLEREGGLDRLEALAREDARFADANPPGPAVGEIRRRASGPEAARRPRRVLLTLAPIAAAAVFLLVLRPGPGPVGDEETRLKGGSARLAIHRQGQTAGAEPEALVRGARARAGDVLQVSVLAAGRSFGVVVSVDGRGVVTRHGPGEGDMASPLPRGGVLPLDHSYRLDDAPAFERFFLVTGDAPFAVEPVVEAFQRLAADGRAATEPPALPSGLAWTDFLLEKAP